MIHSTFVPFCYGLWVNLHEYLTRRQTFTQHLDEGMHEEENLFDVEQVLGGEPLGITLKVLVQLGMSSLKLWGKVKTMITPPCYVFQIMSRMTNFSG